jgi:hypothetical protein
MDWNYRDTLRWRWRHSVFVRIRRVLLLRQSCTHLSQISHRNLVCLLTSSGTRQYLQTLMAQPRTTSTYCWDVVLSPSRPGRVHDRNCWHTHGSRLSLLRDYIVDEFPRILTCTRTSSIDVVHAPGLALHANLGQRCILIHETSSIVSLLFCIDFGLVLWVLSIRGY